MSRPSRPQGARLLAVAVVAAATAGAGLGCAQLASAAPTAAPAASTQAPTAGGAFVPVAPTRVIDTRNGTGVAKARLGAGASLTSSMVGRDGLPAAGVATAVVLNLTATSGTTSSYLTAYATGHAVPPVSSLSFGPANATANLVTVPLGTDGRISVYNKVGSTDVVADVVGYYAAASNATYGGLTPVPPKRLFDSRKLGQRFGNGGFVDLFSPYLFQGKDHSADVTGWVLDVTAVGATSDGYVTAWDGVGAKPGTSSVNFHKGVTVTNLVEVKSGTVAVDGKPVPSFKLQTTMFGGTTALVVDVIGVYTKPGTSADARFRALPTPVRLVDTRSAQKPDLAPMQKRLFSAAAVTDESSIAVAGNLTVATPTEPTYIAVNDPLPPETAATTSNLNVAKGATRANSSLFAVGVATDDPDSFQVFNLSGTTPFVVDAVGTFDLPGAPAVSRAAAGTAALGTPGARMG